MNKRIIAFIVAGFLLSGCSAGSPANLTAEPALTPGSEGFVSASTETPAQTPEKIYEQPEMKGELSISVMDEIGFLSDAAESFMLKYPDVKVNINVFRELEMVQVGEDAYTSADPEEGFTTEDYLSQLNTKIMSQNAEDIIMTSGLRMDKYNEMGAFEDLSWYLSQTPEINPEKFYMPIIENLRTGGKLFEMPMSFSIRTMDFNNKLMEESGLRPYENYETITNEEAVEIGKQIVDLSNLPNTYLCIGNAHNIATDLVRENLEKFIDFETKKVDFAAEDFYKILEESKALADGGYFDNGTIDFYNMEYYFAYNDDFDTQAALFSLLPDAETRAIPVGNTRGEVLYVPMYSFGINSNSSVKELAWEFIKFLLSDEVQASSAQYSLGVNRSSLRPLAERNLSIRPEDMNVDLEEYVSLLNKWAEMAAASGRIDGALLDIIYFEIIDYMDGKKSAEQAAADINTKLDKYFNE